MRAAYAECAQPGGGIPRRAVAGRPDRGAAWCCRPGTGWSGGARWFRCDVAQADLDGSSDTSRTGSLAGALAGASPLRLGCFNPKVNADAVRTMTAGRLHRSRTPPSSPGCGPRRTSRTPNRSRTATAARAGCRSAIASFTGVPDDDDVQYRTGWISYNPTRTEWQQGERRVRCFLWFSDRKLTRSLAGAGRRRCRWDEPAMRAVGASDAVAMRRQWPVVQWSLA